MNADNNNNNNNNNDRPNWTNNIQLESRGNVTVSVADLVAIMEQVEAIAILDDEQEEILTRIMNMLFALLGWGEYTGGQ